MPLVVRLQGGLGNQLFQLCAGLLASSCTGRPLVLDDLGLRAPSRPGRVRRRLEIEDLITDEESSSIVQSLCHRISAIGDAAVVELDMLDDALKRLTMSSKVLIGYFQRHSIVDHVAPDLLARFEASPRLRNIVDCVTRPAIAVHVRCGDYLTPRARAFHGFTSASSLVRCIRQAAEESGLSKVVVVSDDPARAHAMMGATEIESAFDLEYSAGVDPWEDLRTISSCAAIIMNNSSFSWWGGYLASRCRSAIVFAPTPWYARESGVESVLFDPSWRTYERVVLSSGELS